MRLIRNNIVIVVLMSLTLASCVVGKKYKRPDLATPDSYRSATTLTGDSVMLPWRTFFKDEQLITLVNQALEKNKEVSVAVLNMDQLELSFKQAKLGLLPTLDLSVSASRIYQSQNSLNGSLSQQFTGSDFLDDFTANLSLSWEADIWGKAKMQKDGAKANYFMQKENLAALKTRIISQVAQAYYNLLSLDEQLKVAERNIALSDSTLRMIQLQFNAAQVNSLGVEQALAQKKTAELLVPLAKQNIALQENALSILCGDYPKSIERSKSFTANGFADVFADGVPARLLSRRPDLRASEYAVVSANAQTGLAKAAMYPSLSITPSIGANSFQFNNWFDLPGSLVKNIGGNLAQPIFRKKALKTSYEIAKLEQQKSAEQFRQAMMVAVGEVSDAVAKTSYANERLVLVGEKKTALDKAVRNALLLYKNGMSNYLDVIVAQNNALQNELEVISIRKEKYDASIELYRALGGGTE
ncbi:MAG: TolC family protein [Flavobacteriales bacterium]|nr:MAG: TolC family protein [Flavobacteriales bacterium]